MESSSQYTHSSRSFPFNSANGMAAGSTHSVGSRDDFVFLGIRCIISQAQYCGNYVGTLDSAADVVNVCREEQHGATCAYVRAGAVLVGPHRPWSVKAAGVVG